MTQQKFPIIHSGLYD